MGEGQGGEGRDKGPHLPSRMLLMRLALAASCSFRHSTSTSSTLESFLRRAFINSSAASPSVLAAPTTRKREVNEQRKLTFGARARRRTSN